jgi:hypothetical protein
LYVRSRAISSRTNDNYDTFPAEEIKKGYLSFIGKPVFVNHENENHRRARGVILDAQLHEDLNPDGSADTWVEVLMEVDAINFPKLAEAIVKGHIERTSMGVDVEMSECGVCHNEARTPMQYCAHIPRMKGSKIRQVTASGSQQDLLVHEVCYGLAFFENSLLVEEPADPTAFSSEWTPRAWRCRPPSVPSPPVSVLLRRSGATSAWQPSMFTRLMETLFATTATRLCSIRTATTCLHARPKPLAVVGYRP